jgi:putative oxidoreductase
MRAYDLSAVGDLIGRILLASLFILEAVSKIETYEMAARYTAAFGVPAQLLPFAIALELGGGLMIALGWRTRWAALALAVFCAAAALIFHTNFAERNQVIHFEKDLALAGAFLILAARGAGRLSLDRRGERSGA